MITIEDRLKAWPRNNAGQPIFKTSEQAIFYAVLIYDKPDRVDIINKLRRNALADIGQRRKKNGANMDLLMQLAVKAQFARECLEEVDRLKNSTYQLNQGGH